MKSRKGVMWFREEYCKNCHANCICKKDKVTTRNCIEAEKLRNENYLYEIVQRLNND